MLLDFDRDITLAINGSGSLVMDSIMMIISSTYTWIPLGLFVLYMIYKNYGWKTLLFVALGIGLCIFLADFVSSGIVKPLVARWRPARDPEIMYMVDVVDGYRGGRYGFFSSHAANTMSVAVFLSMIFKKRLLTCLFVSWSLLNCWSRMYLGVHYFGDISVGIIWGVMVGLGVYLLFRCVCKPKTIENPTPLAAAVLLTYVIGLLLAPIIHAGSVIVWG